MKFLAFKVVFCSLGSCWAMLPRKAPENSTLLFNQGGSLSELGTVRVTSSCVYSVFILFHQRVRLLHRKTAHTQLRCVLLAHASPQTCAELEIPTSEVTEPHQRSWKSQACPFDSKLLFKSLSCQITTRTSVFWKRLPSYPTDTQLFWSETASKKKNFQRQQNYLQRGDRHPTELLLSLLELWKVRLRHQPRLRGSEEGEGPMVSLACN
jgi:hypothetical protein